MNIGQPTFEAIVLEGQSLMVEVQQVERICQEALEQPSRPEPYMNLHTPVSTSCSIRRPVRLRPLLRPDPPQSRVWRGFKTDEFLHCGLLRTQ